MSDEREYSSEGEQSSSYDEGKGKKVYDHSFLLQFRPLCTEKPEGLQSAIDIIIGSKGGSRQTASRDPREANKPLRKTYSSGNISAIRNGRDGRDNRDNRDGNRRKGSGQKKGSASNSSPQLGPHVPLVHSADRWIRPTKSQQDKTEALLRKVNGLLNKLTLDKFESLCQQILAIEVDSPEILIGLIKLTYDKAVAEPHFSKMYAELCCRLSERAPTFQDPSDNTPIGFRRILLNKCQEEFENKADKSAYDNLPPPDKDEALGKLKRRMLGNMKFIGELFKKKMLTEKIMHECIINLFGDVTKPDEENMECLVKLLKTIGHMLENPKSTPKMDAYFSRMKILSDDMSLPSRIRFMLQDLLELRANRWISKRKGNEPQPTEIRRDQTPASPSKNRGGPQPAGNKGHPNNGSPRTSKLVNDTRQRSISKPDGGSWKGDSGSRHDRLRSDSISAATTPLSGSYDSASSSPLVKRMESSPQKSALSTEEKINLLVEELLSSSDVKEAVACLRDAISAGAVPAEAVSQIVTIALEKKDKQRETVSKLLAEAEKARVLTATDISSGYDMLVDLLDDLDIDMPFAWKYLSEFFGRSIIAGALVLSPDDNIIDSVQGLPKGPKMIAQVLETIAQEAGEGALKKMLHDTGFELTLSVLEATKGNAKLAFLASNGSAAPENGDGPNDADADEIDEEELVYSINQLQRYQVSDGSFKLNDEIYDMVGINPEDAEDLINHPPEAFLQLDTEEELPSLAMSTIVLLFLEKHLNNTNLVAKTKLITITTNVELWLQGKLQEHFAPCKKDMQAWYKKSVSHS